MDVLVTFLDMGGYAAFVWPSFAITAAVLAGLLAASLRFLRTGEARLRSLLAAANSGAGEASGET